MDFVTLLWVEVKTSRSHDIDSSTHTPTHPHTRFSKFTPITSSEYELLQIRLKWCVKYTMELWVYLWFLSNVWEWISILEVILIFFKQYIFLLMIFFRSDIWLSFAKKLVERCELRVFFLSLLNHGYLYWGFSWWTIKDISITKLYVILVFFALPGWPIFSKYLTLCIILCFSASDQWILSTNITLDMFLS